MWLEHRRVGGAGPRHRGTARRAARPGELACPHSRLRGGECVPLQLGCPRRVGFEYPHRFRLDSRNGATEVTLAPHYRLRYGVLGSLLDVVFVPRTYRSGVEALLRGLKRHLEGG